MSDQTPEFNDEQFKLEQHDFLKREGIAAYFDMLLEGLVGDKLDPAKRQLMKDGLSALFAGPPMTPPAIPVVAPKPFFEEHWGDGISTIWNWPALMQSASHAIRLKDGSVEICERDETIFTLENAAAKAFWEWYTALSSYPTF